MASLDRPREPSEGDSPRRTSEEAMSRLNVLSNAAKAHGMPAEVESADGGQNYYVRLDRRPFAPARVFCGTRPSDGNRLWFYGDGAEWITEADEPHSITAALTWLKRKHAEAEAEAERTRLRTVLELDEADDKDNEPGDDEGDDVPFAAEADDEAEGAPLVRM